MGFKELLENFKLVDFQVKVNDFLNGKNVGLINIVVEKKTYNIVLPDSEKWESFVATPITPEKEVRIKERSEEKLKCLDSEFDLLPREAALNIVTATIATTATDLSIEEEIKIKDEMVASVDKPIKNDK
ncbi:MAG TPA: hypothetical protein PKZ42_01875 [Syntrophales bacterium]|nr:hypothetical protein [Syntrophales bacterium]